MDSNNIRLMNVLSLTASPYFLLAARLVRTCTYVCTDTLCDTVAMSSSRADNSLTLKGAVGSIHVTKLMDTLRVLAVGLHTV